MPRPIPTPRIVFNPKAQRLSKALGVSGSATVPNVSLPAAAAESQLRPTREDGESPTATPDVSYPTSPTAPTAPTSPNAEPQAEWKSVVTALNRMHLELRESVTVAKTDLPDSSETTAASLPGNISAETLESLDAQGIEALEAGINARARFTRVYQILRDHKSALENVNSPASDQSSSVQTVTQDTEEWLNRLSECTADASAGVPESPCLAQHQKILPFLVDVARAGSPSVGTEHDEMIALMSREFQSQCGAFRVVAEITNKVVSDIPIDEVFLADAEQTLVNSGVSLDERSEIWLWGSRHSALLGERDHIRRFLTRTIDPELLTQEFTNAKSQFLQVQLTSVDPDTQHVSAVATRFGMSSLECRQLTTTTGNELLKPFRERLQIAAIHELELLEPTISECLQEIEQRLLDHLSSLAVVSTSTVPVP